jgi:DNA repair exonuclease SbcCD nuclease subunit
MEYLTGDTHGRTDIGKLSYKHWPQSKDLTIEDNLIILGDFGVIWSNIQDSEEKHLLRFLRQRNYKILVVRGNHDNHPRLNSFPEINMFGDKVKQISDNVFMLIDGHIYTINGQTYFVLGGAESVDKMYRREGINWWPEEIPSYLTVYEGFERLKDVNNKVDYVLTHAIFYNAYEHIFGKYGEKINDPMSKTLQILKDTITYKYWYCGHYHCNLFIKEYNAQILYESIIKVGETTELLQENAPWYAR